MRLWFSWLIMWSVEWLVRLFLGLVGWLVGLVVGLLARGLVGRFFGWLGFVALLIG